METYTMAELNRNLKRVCAQPEPSLITNKGKPQSLLINVADLPIDESISFAQELYGRYCVQQTQRQAAQNGLADMSMEEIDAEIAAVRASRR
ncbi:MAG: hypothetical protein LBH64_04055 [Coriobacteriales bacterium]|jgi:hypothetical protein|nr:hypothetical protein [Coriobacteriales bacterium]